MADLWARIVSISADVLAYIRLPIFVNNYVRSILFAMICLKAMFAASIVLLLGLLSLCSAEYPYPSIIYGRSCDVDLIFDQALVQFTTNTFGYGLYATNSQCYKCERQLVSAGTSSNLCEIMYSPFYWTFDLVQTSTGNVVYSIDLKLEQQPTQKL